MLILPALIVGVYEFVDMVKFTIKGRLLNERITPPTTPPPPLPIELRPKKLYCEWICFGGVWFRKKEIKCLTENPNKTINVVMDGVKYNTGMHIDELLSVLTEDSEDAQAVLNQRKKLKV